MLRHSYLCPYCEWSDVNVSCRRPFDWVMYLFGIQPVRCLACRKRFYVRKSVVEHYDDAYGGQRPRARCQDQEYFG